MAEPSTSSPPPSPRTPSSIHFQQEFQQQQQPAVFSLTSHDTALALVPPSSLWPRIDRLRALYDKAYPKWPPHVNLVYPFVRPDLLDEAVDRVAAALSSSFSWGSTSSPKRQIRVRLARPGVFEHGGRKNKNGNTIYLCDDEDPGQGESVCLGVLEGLRNTVLASLGQASSSSSTMSAGQQHRAPGGGRGDYRMHLTVAQSEDVEAAPHKFLLDKVGLLPPVEWEAAELAVLVRERDGGGGSVMRLWGRIGLEDGRVERLGSLAAFYQDAKASLLGPREGEDAERDLLQSGVSYCGGEEPERWAPPFVPPKLAVASYNVLAEFEWPPSEARYPLVVRNILAENAQADVLVLQEVTDGFLSYLLSDKQIREAYPFCSHGPPHLDGIEPLPSFLNIVVLSATPFDWEYVSLNRKHKGVLVARFKRVGRTDGDKFLPVVLAAVHLTHGLADGAVASKKSDIKRIIGYLSKNYPDHPWILAGDFNATTSSISINAAVKAKAISEQSASHLASLDNLFSEARLVDAWKSTADNEADDQGVEGERGATWDPTANGMAAVMAASGGNKWPHRYDRILVRGEGFLEIADFNMFGFLTEQRPESELFASDHWGVRCTLNMSGLGESSEEPSEEISELVVPVQPEKGPEHLVVAGSVKDALVELQVIPSEADATKRKRALDLLKSVILDTTSTNAARVRSHPTIVVVPVGSYALGVWTSSSDIDVLCIGPFSSNTFFALASQRLRKASAQGIRILRRVQANTGTMLELEVDGIRFDLQYCPAASIAERWPDVLRASASDPVWSLSAQALSKLKAIRDIDYLRRSLPDLTAFRLAHRFVKTWAKARGIYSARFGFLSGIQIAILLARVQKLLARELGASPTPEALVATFFHHYARFDWSARLAFDPFFHRRRLPYSRTAREPLAILGYFPPALNTALAASVPSARTLASEFRRASEALLLRSATAATAATNPASSLTSSWSSLLSSPAAHAAEFLAAHKSYVRLDVQYWGLSRSRSGARFLGWLESRCVGLLVDLHRRAPGLHVRMWPARFVERDGESGNIVSSGASGTGGKNEEEEGITGDERDFRCCYLIGLDKGSPDMSKEDLKVAFGALQTGLARFEAQMRGDEKYFDAKSCWLSATVVNRAELGELELDSREWGEHTLGEEEFDEEDEEGEEEAASGLDSEHDEFARKENKKKKKGGSAARKQIAAVDLRADKTKKFRTAADALNRIRWDPQLDSSDYVVGYEDRFIGVQEKELGAWKSEQTDDEFIPQHRILYFRRKSDGKLVWDRRTRLDELFGNAA